MTNRNTPVSFCAVLLAVIFAFSAVYTIFSFRRDSIDDTSVITSEHCDDIHIETMIETEAEETTVVETTAEETTATETTEAVTIPIILTADNAEIPAYLGLDGIENEFPGAVLTATDDMGSEYLDSIIFLGDSRTYGLTVYAALSEGKSTKQVWTPSNHTLLLSSVADKIIFYPDTGEEMTVRDALALKKPDILMVALGINGVSYLREDGFISQFDLLIAAVREASPDTKIILQSMLPVAASYKDQESINNNKIQRGNYWMAKAAYNNDVFYLNAAEMFVGEDGFLSNSYQSGDGLHLSKSAYTILTDYIRTHGIQ